MNIVGKKRNDVGIPKPKIVKYKLSIIGTPLCKIVWDYVHNYKYVRV